MKKLLLPLFIVVCLVGDTTTRAITATPNVTSWLGNISTRGFVQTGDNVMIGGFVVQGTQPKTVIVRAIGPELTAYGIPNVLANPTLELRNGTGALIASNDDWQTTILGGIITGDQVMVILNNLHAPTVAHESAMVATLQPGNTPRSCVVTTTPLELLWWKCTISAPVLLQLLATSVLANLFRRVTT